MVSVYHWREAGQYGRLEGRFFSSGRRIMVVREAGGLAAGVRFSPARPTSEDEEVLRSADRMYRRMRGYKKTAVRPFFVILEERMYL